MEEYKEEGNIIVPDEFFPTNKEKDGADIMLESIDSVEKGLKVLEKVIKNDNPTSIEIASAKLAVENIKNSIGFLKSQTNKVKSLMIK